MRSNILGALVGAALAIFATHAYAAGQTKPLPNTPFKVTVDAKAKLTPQSGSDAASIHLGNDGVPLQVTKRGFSVLGDTLEEVLQSLAKDHCPILKKEGSGNTFTIAWSDSPAGSIVQYMRFFSVDGKDWKCYAGGIDKSEIAAYDRVCKSVTK
jgi:hypothetical protein